MGKRRRSPRVRIVNVNQLLRAPSIHNVRAGSIVGVHGHGYHTYGLEFVRDERVVARDESMSRVTECQRELRLAPSLQLYALERNPQ